MLASNLRTKRLNKVGMYLHCCFLKKNSYQVSPKWYHNNPTPTAEIDNITIMWDVPIPTDSKVPHNRPDIIVYNRNERTCTN